MPTQYSGDILVYVILALIGFLGIIIGLVVWVMKTELRHIRNALHDLRSAIQDLIVETIKAFKN